MKIASLILAIMPCTNYRIIDFLTSTDSDHSRDTEQQADVFYRFFHRILKVQKNLKSILWSFIAYRVELIDLIGQATIDVRKIENHCYYLL